MKHQTNTTEIRQKVAELKQIGKTWTEIAKETKLSMANVGELLRHVEVDKKLMPSRLFAPPDEDIAFYKLKINGGRVTQEEMAIQFNVSLMTIKRWINRYKAKKHGNDIRTIQEKQEEAK